MGYITNLNGVSRISEPSTVWMGHIQKLGEFSVFDALVNPGNTTGDENITCFLLQQLTKYKQKHFTHKHT